MDTITRRALTTTAFAAGTYAAARATICWLRKYDFRNRLVVITGGSRGLGLLLARHLARQEAALVICARDDEELANAEEELRNIAPYVAAYTCDLTQPDEITELFNRIRREIGSVDVLINNAGRDSCRSIRDNDGGRIARGDGNPFLGAVSVHSTSASGDAPPPARPHCEHRLHRRKNRFAPSRALLCQQVRLGWTVQKHAG